MDPFSDHANSPEEWAALGTKWAAAAVALRDQGFGIQGWSLAGFACECVIKARAMKHLRLNAWPSRTMCRQKGWDALYTHDLIRIAELAGISIQPMDAIAPKWKVVIQWSRHHMYANGSAVTDRVLDDLYTASLGAEGVLQWLEEKL